MVLNAPGSARRGSGRCRAGGRRPGPDLRAQLCGLCGSDRRPAAGLQRRGAPAARPGHRGRGAAAAARRTRGAGGERPGRRRTCSGCWRAPRAGRRRPGARAAVRPALAGGAASWPRADVGRDPDPPLAQPRDRADHQVLRVLARPAADRGQRRADDGRRRSGPPGRARCSAPGTRPTSPARCGAVLADPAAVPGGLRRARTAGRLDLGVAGGDPDRRTGAAGAATDRWLRWPWRRCRWRQRAGERARRASRCHVVVAVYNTMPYLTECLNSLVEQTIGLDRMEIIAVDDGSTDGSGAELDRFAAPLPGHRHGDPPGQLRRPGRARATAAWTLATGRYVFFVGADDYLGPEALRAAGRPPPTSTASDVVLGRLVGVNGRYVYQDDLRPQRARHRAVRLAAAVVAVQHQAVPAGADRAARHPLPRGHADRQRPAVHARGVLPGRPDLGAGRLRVLLRGAPARRAATSPIVRRHEDLLRCTDRG